MPLNPAFGFNVCSNIHEKSYLLETDNPSQGNETKISRSREEHPEVIGQLWTLSVEPRAISSKTFLPLNFGQRKTMTRNKTHRAPFVGARTSPKSRNYRPEKADPRVERFILTYRSSESASQPASSMHLAFRIRNNQQPTLTVRSFFSAFFMVWDP